MSEKTTADDVAEWMYERVQEKGAIDYHRTALDIKEKFGDQFTRRLKSGYVGITQEVRDVFRELSEDDVIWQRTGTFWRLRRENDPPGRQV